MDDLRREIRGAFETEQAAYPPAGDLRPRLVRSAVVRPRRQRSLQWLAVAAAVMLAVLVVVGLMSSRTSNRGTVSPPKPASSPVGDYGTPPAGEPLFYVRDPNHPTWYIGFDWNGVPRGTIKLSETAEPNAYLRQTPDGSMFVLTPAAKGGDGHYLDRLGRPVAGASIYLPLQMWADDNRHYCTLDGFNGQWTLGLRTPGSVTATAHAVAIDSPNLRSGIIAIGFGSCSTVHDRAVLVYSYFPRPPEVWVVRISDGKVLSDHTYDTTYSDVTASSDGALVAVNSAKSTGYLAGPTAPSTRVIRASNGSLVASLDPSFGVLGFSADDSLALVATSPYASGVATHLAAVDLTTGKVIWRYDGDEYLSGFFIEPIGAAFAVMLQPVSDSDPHPTVSLTIVYRDGRSSGPPGTFLHP